MERSGDRYEVCWAIAAGTSFVLATKSRRPFASCPVWSRREEENGTAHQARPSRPVRAVPSRGGQHQFEVLEGDVAHGGMLWYSCVGVPFCPVPSQSKKLLYTYNTSTYQYNTDSGIMVIVALYFQVKYNMSRPSRRSTATSVLL